MALLSTLMGPERSAQGADGDPAAKLPEHLRQPFNQVKAAAKRIGDISQARRVVARIAFVVLSLWRASCVLFVSLLRLTSLAAP